ncbi:hypothetical protein BGX38DRAFT_580242 [Terfezia claveryi]|nr:hypothetical protein BGX38DRAFT_580242 [Terfezia claveryi]
MWTSMSATLFGSMEPRPKNILQPGNRPTPKLDRCGCARELFAAAMVSGRLLHKCMRQASDWRVFVPSCWQPLKWRRYRNVRTAKQCRTRLRRISLGWEDYAAVNMQCAPCCVKLSFVPCDMRHATGHLVPAARAWVTSECWIQGDPPYPWTMASNADLCGGMQPPYQACRVCMYPCRPALPPLMCC